MMGKLVTEDISQLGVEVRTEVTIEAVLDLIMSIEVIQDIIKILGVGQHIVSIIEVFMVAEHEVIKSMEDITIMEEVVTEIKLIIEEGVGHLKDRIEVGEMIEVGVRVGLSQALGQVQIDRIRCFECRGYDHFAPRMSGEVSQAN